MILKRDQPMQMLHFRHISVTLLTHRYVLKKTKVSFSSCCSARGSQRLWCNFSPLSVTNGRQLSSTVDYCHDKWDQLCFHPSEPVNFSIFPLFTPRYTGPAAKFVANVLHTRWWPCGTCGGCGQTLTGLYCSYSHPAASVILIGHKTTGKMVAAFLQLFTIYQVY